MKIASNLAGVSILVSAFAVFGCSSSDALLEGIPSDAATDSSSNPDSTTDAPEDPAFDQDAASQDSTAPDSAIQDSSIPDVVLDSGITDTSIADSPADVPLDIAPDLPDGSLSCAPPSDPKKASLCLHLIPDSIKPIPTDPALDGKGVLLIQVFDTPNPDKGDAGKAKPIMEAVVPQQQADGGVQTIDVSALPALHRFDGLAGSVVYVQALFLDDLSALKPGYSLNYGTWMGGLPLMSGLSSNLPLEPVAIKAGQATTSDLKLTAFRRFKATLRASGGLSMIGNGQGPAKVVLLASQQLSGGNMAMYGYATAACGDIKASGGIQLEGFVFGQGPYYALGLVDDLGTDTGSNLPPGSLVNLNMATGSLPASSKVSYAADAYEVTKELTLDAVVPTPILTDKVTCSSP